jgi:hypothetical protein
MVLFSFVAFFICLYFFLTCPQSSGDKEYKCVLCQKTEKGSRTEEVPSEVTPDSLEALYLDQIKPFTDEVALTNGKVCIRIA